MHVEILVSVYAAFGKKLAAVLMKFGACRAQHCWVKVLVESSVSRDLHGADRPVSRNTPVAQS